MLNSLNYLNPGADEKGRFLPITTSYDYDAPISEAGDLTPKFFALRNVISKVPFYYLGRRENVHIVKEPYTLVVFVWVTGPS